MLDYGFDDQEDFSDEQRLTDLVSAYERFDGDSYFDSEALEEIATYYFERGEFEHALGVIDRLIETYPFSSDAWMRRGVLMNNLGRHPDALEAYDRSLAINPNDTETIVNRGIPLDSLNRSEEALDA